MRVEDEEGRENGSRGAATPNLAEQLHLATRNRSIHLGMLKAYEIHFDPTVTRLVAEAPLQLPGRPRVELPPPRALDDAGLGTAIRGRRSGRDFGPASLAAEELSTLLHLGGAVHEHAEMDGWPRYQRTAPNSGGMGSIEVYPVVMAVEGVEPGIYHFDSVEHHLSLLHAGAFRDWLRHRVLFQLEFPDAAVALILTAAFGRLQAKYGLRGYRFGFLDAGHVSQNLYLVASALGLEVCATAGFVDEQVDSALGIDGLDVATVLVLLFGPPA
jgi:SagB-type dehydrogenase family enzyme